MSEPWFDPNTFGTWWGVIAGGGGGTLGGLWGALAGTLVPRGRSRAFVLGFGWALLGLGVASLALGLVALADGQPYGIWYGPVLTGVTFIVVIGVLLPMVKRFYTAAEERRVQAEAFRAQ